MKTELKFTKMTGAGNDFIVIEAGDGQPVPAGKEVADLCHRKYGIGADGLMIFRGREQTAAEGGPRFEVDFFNSDGTSGMLCGNGARCVLEYARATARISPGLRIAFLFAGSAYSGESLGEGQARFFLSPRYTMGEAENIEIGGNLFRGCTVDVGSLHFILDMASLGGIPGFGSLAEAPVIEIGRLIRHHPRFAPQGVNVSFTAMTGGKLQIRTYERGVEDETLACGTGSTSAALVRWREGEARPPVNVVTQSGEELIIDFIPRGERATELSLTGPARRVFYGRIPVEAATK